MTCKKQQGMRLLRREVHPPRNVGMRVDIATSLHTMICDKLIL